jgi:hypothetical protein
MGHALLSTKQSASPVDLVAQVDGNGWQAGDTLGGFDLPSPEAVAPPVTLQRSRVTARDARMNPVALAVVPSDEAMDLALRWIAQAPQLRVEVTPT